MGNTISKRNRSKKAKYAENKSEELFEPQPISSNDSTVRYSGGRRYFYEQNSLSLLPNDEREIKRIYNTHYCLKEIFQTNFTAPVKQQLHNGCQVLEFGCGQGIWSLDMAQEFPQSKFIGVDADNIFKKNEFENIKFVQANIFDGLPFEDDTFDFVSMRRLLSCFTMKQLETIILREIARVIKPGGWLDWTEYGFNMQNSGEVTEKVIKGMCNMMCAHAINPHLPLMLPKVLTYQALWKNIIDHQRLVVLGSQGGEMGRKILENSVEGLYSYKKVYLEFTSQDSEEFDKDLETFFEEVERFGTMNEWHRCCAQKI
ncbi:hypothetical protein G9A89_010694 [Geosiphon pyriformis]|nr:hypothetical protein G9A89_010694 [Geosiphon pyriformis]